MTMRTLPIDASDGEIKALVVEWHELLADGRYEEALGLFPASDEEGPWTPALLRQTIQGYGVPEPSPDVIESMLEDWGVDRFVITTLLGRPDRDEIIQEKIDVDRENLYGLDPGEYVGMVHYDDVPLSGLRSDLTARFHIKRVGPDRLTLEFLDLHVM